MSERVTWETCPNCQRLAAVAWLNGTPVVCDCPNGCRLPRSRIESAFTWWPVARGRESAALSAAVNNRGAEPRGREGH